ncbi:MAG: hypothetical protein ACEY3J_01360 [Arsenophonus sp.]
MQDKTLEKVLMDKEWFRDRSNAMWYIKLLFKRKFLIKKDYYSSHAIQHRNTLFKVLALETSID